MSENKETFVYLYRKLVKNEIIHDPTALQIFIYFLLTVDYETGERTIGRFHASEFLQINPSTFYKALKRLEKKYKVVTLTVTGNATRIKLIHWANYQAKAKTVTPPVTLGEHFGNTSVTLDQEYKNKRIKEVVDSNKRKILLLLNEKEFLLEKSNQFNLDSARIRSEVKLCADWWEDQRKKLTHPKAAVNNWLKRISPADSEERDFIKKRIAKENSIPDSMPVLTAEQREKNLEKLNQLKEKLRTFN